MDREQERQTGASIAVTEGNGGRKSGLQATRGWPGLLGGGIPASSWELVRRMSEEMNQLFESLGGTGAGRTGIDRRRSPGTAPLLVPRTEVIQQPGALLVRVEMPGMTADEIDVTVENGVLAITGERRREDREEGEGFVRSELVYGTFFRSIPLPDGADEKGIVAVVRNGVLEVTIPISKQQHQGRRVEVQAGEGSDSKPTRGEPGRTGSESPRGE
jgi:HSP20 family protein